MKPEKFNLLTFAINLVSLAFIFVLLFQIGFGSPSTEALAFHPIPDAAEQAWCAIQFANNQKPLIPLSNELHPSRYSPVHSFLISIPLRFSSDKFGAIYYWSPFAIILGSIFILLWLQLCGLKPEMIAFLFYLTLTTPLFFDASKELLQDTTLFLLFFLGQLLWYLSLVKDGCDKNRLNNFLLMATGILIATVISIRPTYFPLLVLMIGQYLYLFKRTRLKSLLIFSGSTIGFFLLIIGFQCWISNKWIFSGYYHWESYLKIFSFAQPFNVVSNLPDQPVNGLLILNALLGITDSWTDFQWPSQALVLLLGVVGLFLPGKEKEGVDVNLQKIFKTQIIVLLSFAWLQILIHLFYYFYAPRFFLTIQFIFVLSAIYGLNRLISITVVSGKWIKLGLSIVILFAVIPMSSVYRIHIILNELTKRNYKNPLHAHDIYYKNYHENSELIKQLDCPLFVSSIPLLNARLLLEQEENKYPVSEIFLTDAAIQNPQPNHLLVMNPGKPCFFILPEKDWPKNHQFSFLYNPITKEVNEEWLDYLINRFGKIAVYVNLGDYQQFKPVLEYAKENDFVVREISRLSWLKLFVITKEK